jgi:hypothetical protein
MVDLEELAASLESLPDVLTALLTPLNPTALQRRPADSEWCALEVIGHLVIVDGPAFRERIRRIVAGESEIVDVDGGALARGEDFGAAPLSELLDRLRSERTLSAELVRSLRPLDLELTSRHHTLGLLSAGDFAHEWPYHDQDHIQQILDAIKPRYLESMTANMRNALLQT